MSSTRGGTRGGIMRRTSMILADTGERVHANTIRSPTRTTTSLHPDRTVSFSETSPLIQQAPPTSRSLPTSSPRELPKTNTILQNSVKCSLAYTLCSLFVLSPLRTLFGDFPSKHQIATVSIYFNPARTVGSMIQACGYVVYALLYGTCVGFCSMFAAHILLSLQWFGVGVDILLFLFCGMAFSLLAYTKIKISMPTFDTACTVAIIFTVTLVIKEDDIQRGILSTDQLLSYLVLVLTGTCISVLVCFTYKPVHATTSLMSALIKLMDEMDVSTIRLFNEFFNAKSTDVPPAVKTDMDGTIIQINSQLAHARFELFATGQHTTYNLLEKIVESHLLLVRHIGGLDHTIQVLRTLLFQDPRLDTLYDEFVQELGPPITSFATTLHDIMRNLPFDDSARVSFNPIYLRSLKAALQLYSEARERALYKVYRSNSALTQSSSGDQAPTSDRKSATPSSSEDSNNSDTTDNEAVIATCGNLSYLLEELGEEVYSMLNLLVDYEKEAEAYRFSLFKVDWKFLFSLPLIPLFPERFKPANKSMPFSKVTEALYPKQQVQATSLRVRLWKILQSWHHYEVRFAFKVGLGSVILSIPAFNDKLRPYFTNWKGEWALIIYLIMMNRDFGTMTTKIAPRLWGTVLGALIAILTWLISSNPWFLMFVAATFSFYEYQKIVAPNANRSALGRFTLTSYNLVSLSNFTRQSMGKIDPDNAIDELLELAFHRVVAVSVGVIWALIISVCIFPDSARAAFRRNLSIQWMRMGVLWKANPLATVPRRDPQKPAQFKGVYGEEELQQGMIELKVRLQSASKEFRLKGKFDSTAFETLYRHTQAILNAYYSFGVLVAKSPTATSKELEMITATHREVDELGSMLFLYFYTASSSLRMGFPVPQELPRPQRTLHRLLRILQSHRNQLLKSPDQDADFEDFVLFYSYVLVTITVTDQLTVINDVLGKLYGDLDDSVFSYT